MNTPLAALPQLLGEWLPAQRWFAGKGRPLAGVSVERTVELRPGEPALHHVVAQVHYADATTERYQLLIGSCAELPQRLEHAGIGVLPGGADEPPRVTYDAVQDTELTAVLLHSIAAGRRTGAVRFSHEPDTVLDLSLTSRVINAEQSNTSLVYGDAYILKLFRRLAPGVNPDLEVSRALASVGCRHIAPPLGSMETTVQGQHTTLAMLQAYLPTATEGWALATTSVRDLYAEGDLHADEVGGDFAAESARLGLATAEVHADLARALTTGLAGAGESAATAQAMEERLTAAVAVVPELANYADPLRAAYRALGRRSSPVPVQRVHGDFHLGQVLRVATGWVLLDFEGEPARSLADRTALMSPLRDVAGMLRSFDYAARHLLTDSPATGNLEYRATEWAERNREAFCDGYTEGSGADPRAEPETLRAFELDKAVYEVVYEARHRPSWLPIPLGSIQRLVG